MKVSRMVSQNRIKWRTEPSKESYRYTSCLATVEGYGGRRFISRGWTFDGQWMPGMVAWAPMPERIEKDRKVWKSPYFGDDPPEKDGLYLVCIDLSKFVEIAYYDSKKDIFLGLGPAEYLAWMEVKPYTGKIMFRGGERCG